MMTKKDAKMMMEIIKDRMDSEWNSSYDSEYKEEYIADVLMGIATDIEDCFDIVVD